LTAAAKYAFYPQMSNPVTDLNLGYGVRCIVGKNLRAKLTSMSYVFGSNTVTKINGSSSPVDCALKFTETSTTTIVLFCLLSVITLGVYLLCTLYVANYIAKDSGSWYNAALRNLANPPPPDHEISQLEPADEEEGPRSSIPEENPIQVFCDVMFVKKEHRSFAVDVGEKSYRGGNVYKLFTNTKFDSDALSRCTVEDGTIVSNKNNPFVAVLKHKKNAHYSFPKLRLDVPAMAWNAFIDKLRIFCVVNGANEFCVKRNEYIYNTLCNSHQWTMQVGIMTGALASKVRGVFLRELSVTVDNPPLNKFFTVQQSTIRSKAFPYVRVLIYLYLRRLQGELSESAAESSQDRLRRAEIDNMNNGQIAVLSEQLSLEGNATAYEDEDAKNVVAAFNQLLKRLEATLRKLLREMPFDFDGTEMTILQYFDATAAEWDGMTESGNGKTNGALLAEAKANADAGMAEFLAEVADNDVQQFLANNAPEVAEP
jgi:hypothetical protein